MKTKTLNWLQVVFYSLFPGAMVGMFYFLMGPFFLEKGYPTIFVLCLAVIFVLVPLEVGIMIWVKKRQGKVILFDKSNLDWKRGILWVVGLVCYSGIIFATIGKFVATWLKQTVFAFMPSWSMENAFEGDHTVLVWTFVFVMVFANVVGPLVEEFYFRGFILSRMPKRAVTSVVMSALLFALYHFWSPWDFVARTVMVIPFGYAVQKTGNIWISIAAHISVNIISSISLITLIA